jgi:6-pyruvoyltetrahydropterin/6-carboxytetrahydropterin synthase
MLRLSRRYTFSAAHRLCRREWDDARNSRIYGRCANSDGHGHNYRLWVTVEGQPDPETGMIIDLKRLDRVVEESFLQRVDHRFLNYEVPEFQTTVPTSENLCRLISRILAPRLQPVRLARVTLHETNHNCFEITFPDVEFTARSEHQP